MSYDSPPNTKTQRGAILALLVKARGEWVALPQIMACAAQYNARVFELRRLGFEIENKTETVGGERHSWFRLTASPKSEAPKPAAPGDWYEAEHGPRPAHVSNPTDGLPLFSGASR